jgi:protein phosphatase
MRTIAFGSVSDTGKIRSENQDALGRFPASSTSLAVPGGQLFIVADGMGGHAGGRIASSLTVQTLGEAYEATAEVGVREALLEGFRKANDTVFRKGRSTPDLAGMGTTCTVLALGERTATIAHVGDSRVYRITRRTIQQLTDDHSKVAEMVRRGIITREEAKQHPERSHLYRALGIKPAVDVDVIERIAVRPETSFLLCTDGLHNLVDDDEMRRVVASLPPGEAAQELVTLANDRGGHDNVSVHVVTVHAEGGALNRLFRGKAQREK